MAPVRLTNRESRDCDSKASQHNTGMAAVEVLFHGSESALQYFYSDRDRANKRSCETSTACCTPNNVGFSNCKNVRYDATSLSIQPKVAEVLMSLLRAPAEQVNKSNDRGEDGRTQQLHPCKRQLPSRSRPLPHLRKPVNSSESQSYASAQHPKVCMTTSSARGPRRSPC